MGDNDKDLIEHFKEMNKLISEGNDIRRDELKTQQDLLDTNTEVRDYLSYISPTKGEFELNFQTTAATPNPPGIPANLPNQAQDPANVTTTATPGYNFIAINARIQRTPRILWIVNDDQTNNLYFRHSTISTENWSEEFVMQAGEKRELNDVWGLLVRSAVAGALFRASEREIYPTSVKIIASVTVSGGIVQISGQLIGISGQCVCTSVSGDVVNIITRSGDYVNISGAVTATFSSGTSVLTSVSGNIVQISGQAVVTDIGSVTSVSGNIVQLASGTGPIELRSGNWVHAVMVGTYPAGVHVDINVNTSGTLIVTTGSGDYVVISGIVFTSVSGNVVQISGQVVKTSGQVANISGQVVYSEYVFKNVSTSGFTTIVQSASVLLHTASVNVAISSTINIWDSSSGSPSASQLVAGINPGVGPVTPGILLYDAKLNSGLVVSTTLSGTNVTLTYNTPAP